MKRDRSKLTFLILPFLKIVVQYVLSVFQRILEFALHVTFAISLFSALQRYVGFRRFINAWIIIILLKDLLTSCCCNFALAARYIEGIGELMYNSF